MSNNETVALEFTFPMKGTINVPASMRGDPGPPGVSDSDFRMGQWTPSFGSLGQMSGQEYNTRWGTYSVQRERKTGNGWCWVKGSLQLSALGVFDDAQLTINLPWPVGNWPGIFDGKCGYISNETPQAEWTPYSWGWPILRCTGNVLRAVIDTSPFPGHNPPPFTGKFLNYHSQFVFSIDYPVGGDGKGIEL